MALLDGLILRAHHTAICVENFESARDFFTEIVGMKIEAEMDQRSEPALGVVVGLPGAIIRWAMLEFFGYRIELFKYVQQAAEPEGDVVDRLLTEYNQLVERQMRTDQRIRSSVRDYQMQLQGKALRIMDELRGDSLV